MTHYSEEQQMIRDMVREFALQELAPLAPRLDAEPRFPAESIPKLAALDLLGLAVPQELGGAGIDALAYSLAIEEVARVCGATALVLLAHNSLVLSPLCAAGTPEQRREWVEPLARGQKLGAFAVSEPESGAGLEALGTTAARHGDAYVLSGSKSLVANAAAADVFLVAARTGPEAGAERGVSTFVVERAASGLGVTATETLGLRGAGFGTVVLDAVEVAASQRLGPEGAGSEICTRAIDRGRIALAALAIGLAQGAFERALRYARERPQFGKPIAAHQSIQWHLAETAVELHTARLAIHDASRRADAGEDVAKPAAIAKIVATEAAVRAGDRAIQIHGGYGYVAEYHVERLYRDAKMCEIAIGANEHLRLLVARELEREVDAGWQLLQ